MNTTDTNLSRVIDDCHELLKWLIPVLDKFPPFPAHLKCR